MRTIKEAMTEIRNADANTSISERGLRRIIADNPHHSIIQSGWHYGYWHKSRIIFNFLFLLTLYIIHKNSLFIEIFNFFYHPSIIR